MKFQFTVMIETTDESFTDPEAIPREGITDYIKVRMRNELLNVCGVEDLSLLSIESKVIEE